MKRIILFVATNLAVMLVMTVAFHVVCALLGVDPAAAFSGTGLDLLSLAVFSLIFGMGGALDSTNAIDAPEVAVITNIGLEHTEYLGKTLGAIAATKAGIIKLLKNQYGVGDWTARQIFNDSINFFYAVDNVTPKAWANLYA